MKILFCHFPPFSAFSFQPFSAIFPGSAEHRLSVNSRSWERRYSVGKRAGAAATATARIAPCCVLLRGLHLVASHCCLSLRLAAHCSGGAGTPVWPFRPRFTGFVSGFVGLRVALMYFRDSLSSNSPAPPPQHSPAACRKGRGRSGEFRARKHGIGFPYADFVLLGRNRVFSYYCNTYLH